MVKHCNDMRAFAAQCLHAVLQEDQLFNHCLAHYKSQCSKTADAAFLQALVFGVMRWYPRLDFVCKKLLNKPLKKKDLKLYYLLLIGLFQLTEMRIPAHAAISETVETTKMIAPWASSLVNAVLRSYQRRSQEMQSAILDNEEAFFAHPTWLIKLVRDAYPEHWQDILNANNTQAPLALRVNLLKVSREKYLHVLKEYLIVATIIPDTYAGICLQSPIDLSQLPGFSEGQCSVQDGAAQLAASLLQLRPNLRILDACSAPGGKTSHILESEPQSECVALDLSRERAEKTRENLDRLGLCASIQTGNACHVSTWWDNKAFDRILLDAPCSATGVIRRHPDIKCLRKPEDVRALTQQQLQLLVSLWPLLKPGGILLYATCSILPEENTVLVRKFLTLHNNAHLQREYQILPGQNNMDGFYYAVLEKKSQEEQRKIL